MEIKDHVIDSRGYVLRGDSRGITVPWTLRKEVWAWCDKNKIAVEYKGSLANMDLWYVRHDQDRALFALRWS